MMLPTAASDGRTHSTSSSTVTMVTQGEREPKPTQFADRSMKTDAMH